MTNYVCDVCRKPIVGEDPHSTPEGEDCHEACCVTCHELTPVERAAALGHDCIDDPPSGAFTSASRWTCTRCGRAVIRNGNVVYGSAIERICGQ